MRSLNFDNELKFLYEQTASHRDSFREGRSSYHSQNEEISKTSSPIISNYYSKIVENLENLPNNFIPASSPKSQLKSIYDIISNLLDEHNYLSKSFKEAEDEGMKGYETCMQKLEADIRDHIRIEQQLKLFAETTQAKIDEYESKAKRKEYEEKKLKSEIHSLKKELENVNNELSFMNKSREATSKKSLGRERSISSNILTAKAYPLHTKNPSKIDSLDYKIADYRFKYMQNYSRGNLASKLFS